MQNVGTINQTFRSPWEDESMVAQSDIQISTRLDKCSSVIKNEEGALDKWIITSLKNLVNATMHYAWKKVAMEKTIAFRMRNPNGGKAPRPGKTDVLAFFEDDANWASNDLTSKDEKLKAYVQTHFENLWSMVLIDFNYSYMDCIPVVFHRILIKVLKSMLRHGAPVGEPVQKRRVESSAPVGKPVQKRRVESSAPVGKPVQKRRVESSAPVGDRAVMESMDAKVHEASIVLHLLAMFSVWEANNMGKWLPSNAVKNAVQKAGGSVGLQTRKGRDWYDCCHNKWGIMDKIFKQNDASKTVNDIHWAFNVENTRAYIQALSGFSNWRSKIDAAVKVMAPIVVNIVCKDTYADGFQLATARKTDVKKLVDRICKIE